LHRIRDKLIILNPMQGLSPNLTPSCKMGGEHKNLVALTM